MIPLLFILSRIIIGFFIGGIWPTAAILGLEIISSKGRPRLGGKTTENLYLIIMWTT